MYKVKIGVPTRHLEVCHIQINSGYSRLALGVCLSQVIRGSRHIIVSLKGGYVSRSIFYNTYIG